MSRITDFVALYRRLGVRPGCSMDEFRQAYRRHVSLSHPDRTGDASIQRLSELQQLNAMYSAALDFHRQHGRLPGAVVPRQPAPAMHRRTTDTDGTAEIRSPRAHRWLVGISLCAGVAILWSARPGQVKVSSSEMDYPSSSAPSHPTSPEVATVIDIGSTTADVLSIEGRPIVSGAGRWDYGPSWIRIEDGRVVDWYSSPLRPLHVLGHERSSSPQGTP